MTSTSMAITMMAQNGAYGNQVKFANAAIPATTIPAILAQPCPISRQIPISTRARPMIRWIQPQAVTSTSNA